MKNIDNRSLVGKTVAMTGCTGGLGRELCFMLAELGASLVMLDRNKEKSKALHDELKEKFNGINIIRIETELEDMSSVKNAVEKLLIIKPNIFIHNAGAYSIPRKICDSGYDNVFQINFVSPYYIIRKLKDQLPSMKAVAVGSIAHTYSHINDKDIDFRSCKSAAKAYGNSKRFLMLSLHELYKNNSSQLAIVHPGITFTNITAHYPKLIFAIIKHPMKIIFMKPKKAAICLIEGVFRNTCFGQWTGPRFFNIWGDPKTKSIKACFSPDSKKAATYAEEIYKSL